MRFLMPSRVRAQKHARLLTPRKFAFTNTGAFTIRLRRYTESRLASYARGFSMRAARANIQDAPRDDRLRGRIASERMDFFI